MSTRKTRTEPTAKRIRAIFGGQVVLDTTSAMLVWGSGAHPEYYVPTSDLLAELQPTTADNPEHASAQDLVVVGDDGPVRSVCAARRHPDLPALDGLVHIDWESVDAWMEEDELVFGHPRDPFVRIDALRSSRTVRIEVHGMLVAQSTRATMLFETGQPERYFLPATDVRLGVLRPSTTVTMSAYRGETRHYSVQVGTRLLDDLVSYHPAPPAECLLVAGQLCFANEQVDLFIDGTRQRRPVTVHR